jgi:hypothetical protein
MFILGLVILLASIITGFPLMCIALALSALAKNVSEKQLLNNVYVLTAPLSYSTDSHIVDATGTPAA